MKKDTMGKDTMGKGMAAWSVTSLKMIASHLRDVRSATLRLEGGEVIGPPAFQKAAGRERCAGVGNRAGMSVGRS